MFLGCGADFCLSCFVSCCVLLGGIVPINHLCCTLLVRSFTVLTPPQRQTEIKSHNVGPGPQPGSFQNPIDWLYFFQKECKIKILANLCWDRCCPTESPDGSTLGGFNHQCQGIFHYLFMPCPFLRVERGPGSCRGLVILTHPLVTFKKGEVGKVAKAFGPVKVFHPYWCEETSSGVAPFGRSFRREILLPKWAGIPRWWNIAIRPDT